jgi:hypothetical protein
MAWPVGRARVRLGPAALGLLVLSLAACGDPRDNPVWTLGGEPGLLHVVKRYYEMNALEENGRCPHPLLDGVTHSRVTQSEPARIEVELGYYYRDAFRGGDDCSRFRLARCGIMRECQGFGERHFVVAKEAQHQELLKDQLKVVEMSGPRRGTVWQP